MEAGGPWDCYHARKYYGWEAERVVAVTGGDNIMELITRARTQLYVVHVATCPRSHVGGHGTNHAVTKKYLQQAKNSVATFPTFDAMQRSLRIKYANFILCVGLGQILGPIVATFVLPVPFSW